MGIASQSAQVLGTTVEIKLTEEHSGFFPFCFDELRRIEARFSRFLPNSDLSRMNSSLGVWQEIPEEIFLLAKCAEEFHSKTEGHFDVGLKVVLDSLGYDKDYSFVQKEMPVFPPMNMPAFLLDEKNLRIRLNRPIEFGGMGKGYALDRVSGLLLKHGVSHYCINAGGDIYAKRGQGEEKWQILLEHPDNPEYAIGQIALDGKSIAGSSPNRRKWGGGKLHHLLNAKTLLPATGTKAIFTLAETGIEADAYATAIFTAGFEEGIELSKKLPVEMLLISAENQMYSSPGFEAEIFA